MNLIESFSAQATRTPNAVAVIDGVEQLSYAELDRLSNGLAVRLIAAGQTGAGSMIAVCVPRSADLIVAVLAVLKTGSAYVPLDLAYPAERLAHILRDSRAGIVVTGVNENSLPAGVSQRVPVDRSDVANASPTPPSSIKSRDLAYVLFTSGSTGQPKGVAIEHCAAAAFLRWATAFFSASDLARVAFTTSICFDLSIFEIFAPLVTGGAVVVADNVMGLAALPAASSLTLINTVPSALSEILDSPAPALAPVINVAGEAVPDSLVARVFQYSKVKRFFNLYGPTESTTYSTVAELRASLPITIGTAIEGTTAYVLDEHLIPVDEGLAGELYLAGAGLARGYINRSGLTAERFVANPFGRGGACMYRTGDRVRLDNNGELVFLGRTDQQVKLRGFRVELGEVEQALRDQAEVDDAVVTLRGGGAAARLVGYVLTSKTLDVQELRTALARRLPAYMVPSSIVRLAQWPRTQNGKIDRSQLPAPPGGGEANDVPHTPHCVRLCEIVREILSVAVVKPGDDFFRLGGHSLDAMRIVSRVRDGFGVDLPLAEIFQYPVLADLADRIVRRLES